MSDLHCAVRSETWDAVPALMRFPRADARVALHLTAASGQTRLVQSILRRFAREETEFAASVMNERGDDENGPPDFALSRVDAAGAAVAAAARGHHSVLAALLDAGLDADAVDERGVHVLTAAAGGGREDAELADAALRYLNWEAFLLLAMPEVGMSASTFQGFAPGAKINAHNDRAPFDYRFIQQYAEADAEVVVRFDIARPS